MGRGGRGPRLALLVPPIALLAVVALALFGESMSEGRTSIATASASPIVAAAARTVEPSRPRTTPSPRSDWPAAINGPSRAGASNPPDPIDWAAIYDERATWATDRAESRRSRRLGAFANYRTDPYER